ncbi:hypothetical protein [Thalassomonas sp. RHCl1]|uniref:hypothetical protein n=1 Tax=Thalassomonas sp. RHCl1 TaxID=2995320 RepID=UPI00248C3CD9|nr:hypothetical protein [Thalassomonas sp. RHCl1]
MAWNTFYFGKENPSLKRRLMVHGMILTMAGAPFAIWVDFAPTKETFISASIVALLPVMFTLARMCFNIEKLMKHYQVVHQSRINKILGFASIPVIVFIFCWLSFVYSFPAVYTIFFGSGYSISAKFEKVDSSSRRSCNYKIKGELLTDLLPSFICIDQAQYESSSNHFTLIGKQSLLGIVYREVQQKANQAAKADITTLQ